jgi:protein kinase C substrate 80K-H
VKSVRRQVKKLKSEIKNREDERDRINQDIDKDYGPDREFTALSKMCVSIHQKPYEYEICPFKEAKQKEGHSSTSLGTYSGWKDDAKYKTMMFTNGQKCWNGPYRSATVHLSCGEDDSLVSADEPSVCAYEFVLKTPAACSESKLHELESQYH